MKKSQIIEIFLHILFWTIWPLIIFMQDQNIIVGVFYSNDPNFYWAMLYGTLFNMFLFYITTYKLLPYFFSLKKYGTGIFVSLSFFLILSVLEGLTDHFIISHFYFPDNSPEIANRMGDQLILAALFLNSPIVLIVFIYRISKDWYRNEKIKHALKEEKLSSELQFLKSQINPHFLFNTLNNLFGMARQMNAVPVADGIAKLSNLMRYMLYDSDAEKVTIAKEISYLQDYIELQKLRIQSTENVKIDLRIENNAPDLKVAPLILIPFIENAFKHGISIKDKSSIEILIKTDVNKLDFYIRNTINKLRLNRNEENSGFGLKNVRKRLELIYPNKHQLEIKQDENTYSVSLTIES